MFKTMQEGLEVYKKEAEEYQEWKQQLSARNDALGVKHKGPEGNFTPNDTLDINGWNERLDAMGVVLGLTPKEAAVIEKKYGIKRSYSGLEFLFHLKYGLEKYQRKAR